VDTASGVEVDGKPGKKDPKKMRAFVMNAKRALE
jgi:phosphoribosylanthranilate isomerase